MLFPYTIVLGEELVINGGPKEFKSWQGVRGRGKSWRQGRGVVLGEVDKIGNKREGKGLYRLVVDPRERKGWRMGAQGGWQGGRGRGRGKGWWQGRECTWESGLAWGRKGPYLKKLKKAGGKEKGEGQYRLVLEPREGKGWRMAAQGGWQGRRGREKSWQQGRREGAALKKVNKTGSKGEGEGLYQLAVGP